jgi:hypothetical protein
MTKPHRLSRLLRVGLAAVLTGWFGVAHALVTGSEGTLDGGTRTFDLVARHDFISTSDGNSHYTWGYSHRGLPMQYPGPTLIVNQGDTVKVTLSNTLPVPVSIVFPGQTDVTALGGTPGLLTREAPAAPALGSPTYTFVASRPGTYLYHSGTNADLQVEMGLVGAIIVRPAGFNKDDKSTWRAYEQPGTRYDRESLFLLSEMDPAIHLAVYGQVGTGQPVAIDMTEVHPSIWFINGRTAPDTLLDEYTYWLPTQPYNALPRMHPGEKLLMRMVNAGRDLHPFHHHGNHATPLARDGRVLTSVPLPGVPDTAANSAVWSAYRAATIDLASPDFTVRAVPGQTMDLVYEWTGKGIGWDIYGPQADNPHTCTPDANGFHSVATDKNYREWCADHNKAIPVIVAGQLDLSYGENYGGSPYLGALGSLPQGHPGLNSSGGYYHMWHSHNEKEVTTDDIFPGGMMTMLVIEPWTVGLEGGTGNTGGGGSGGGGGNDPTTLPNLALLDDFNRANSANLGANWAQTTGALGSGAIGITGFQAVTGAGNLAGTRQTLWNANTFGTSQGVSLTFATSPPNNAGVMLKANGGTASIPTNVVRVQYETAGSGRVSVATCILLGAVCTVQGTLSIGANFALGDTLTATVDATGLARVWKNATHLGVVQLPTTGANAWTTGGGRIGMRFNTTGATVDNFRGGSLP